MACLDTTMLIDLSRTRSSYGRRAVRKCHDLLDRDEMLTTTQFNAAELYVGVQLARDPAAELQKVEELLSTLQILAFDERAAWIFAGATARLRKAGRPAGDMDVLIGATALAGAHVLVTRNPSHYEGIEHLAVESY